MYMWLLPLLAGIYLCMGALVLKITGKYYLWSAILLKVIPFFLGLGCLLVAGKQSGVI